MHAVRITKQNEGDTVDGRLKLPAKIHQVHQGQAMIGNRLPIKADDQQGSVRLALRLETPLRRMS
jgi:hypothetical protein